MIVYMNMLVCYLALDTTWGFMNSYANPNLPSCFAWPSRVSHWRHDGICVGMLLVRWCITRLLEAFPT